LHIPLLKKGETVFIKKWPFAIDHPSKTSNIFYTLIPFVGPFISMGRGWGKDYWSFFCKTSRINQVLSTDLWA
jgi:hypothetical protein